MTLLFALRTFLSRLTIAVLPSSLLVILWLLTPTLATAQTNQLPPDAFEKAINAPSIQLLDVRTKEEYAKEHLKNALNTNIHDQHFDSHLAYLDQSKPVYVYCLSGGRSAKAAERMRKMGFAQVYELQGGMLAWNQAHKAVEKGEATTTGMSVRTFEDILQKHSLVLVDFGATWCPPCKKMAPILSQVSTEFRDQVHVLPLDVDQHAELREQKQIMILPTLLLYKNGKLVWQQTGFVDKASLRKVLETHLH